MPTLTQSESLKIGERGPFISASEVFNIRIKKLGIVCWVEKRRKAPSGADKILREFIDIPTDYELIYGITYKGRDFDCGDFPRDLGKVIKGIEFALI